MIRTITINYQYNSEMNVLLSSLFLVLGLLATSCRFCFLSMSRFAGSRFAVRSSQMVRHPEDGCEKRK